MPDKSIKLLTYNVHSCIGSDRKLDPGRIASVIAAAEADIPQHMIIEFLKLAECFTKSNRIGDGFDQSSWACQERTG